MENNKHIFKKFKAKYIYIVAIILLILSGLWLFANLNDKEGLELKKVGYVREVYREGLDWYMVFDNAQNVLDGSCSDGEECVSDNESIRNNLNGIETLVLDGNIEVDIYSLDEPINESISPRDLLAILEDNGSEFQAIPVVITTYDDVVDEIKEVEGFNE